MISKELRYNLLPQMLEYDRIGYHWLPFVMFSQTPNYRSAVLNTDSRGFRFNSMELLEDRTIFKEDQNKETILVLGGSAVFGIGATSDDKTITGNLSNQKVNYLNLGGRAQVGFQELISIFSNINKLNNIKKIIIISGSNDFYTMDNFSSKYPDDFFFESFFHDSINKSNLSIKKKFIKLILSFFYPNILNNKNILDLNLSNLNKFIFSKHFRESFLKIKNFEIFSFEDKIDRNFKIYNMLGKYFGCPIDFYLQPILSWSKEMCDEEFKLYEYSKKFFKKAAINYETKYTKENYEFLNNLFKNISSRYDINYYDLNYLFKNQITKKDWVFVDSTHCNDFGYEQISNFIKSN